MDDEYCLHAIYAGMEISHCKHMLSLRKIKGFEVLAVFFLWLVKVYLSCFCFSICLFTVSLSRIFCRNTIVSNIFI